MAALPFTRTNQLVRFILGHSNNVIARKELYQQLVEIGSNEGQLCEGIIKHAAGLKLTSEEWFKLLSTLPNKILYSELPLEKILSEEQRQKLKITTLR